VKGMQEHLPCLEYHANVLSLRVIDASCCHMHFAFKTCQSIRVLIDIGDIAISIAD